MLVYDNRQRLRIILQNEGGIVYRLWPLGLVCAAFSFAIAYLSRNKLMDTWWKPFIEHPWGAMVIGSAISFAIVYRTSMAWARYWEASSQLNFMFSKWADCFTQLISFINTAEKRLNADAAKQIVDTGELSQDLEEKLNRLADIRHSYAHYFSLMSALATHRLTHGDLARMRRRSEKFGARSCGDGCCKSLFNVWRNWDLLITSRTSLRTKDVTGAFSMPPLNVYNLEEKHAEIKATLQREKMKADDSPSRSLMNLVGFNSEVRAEEKKGPPKVQFNIDKSDSMNSDNLSELTPPNSEAEESGSPKPKRETSKPSLATRPSSMVIDYSAVHGDSSGREMGMTASKRTSLMENVTWSSDLPVLDPLSPEEAAALDGEGAAQGSVDRVNLVTLWIQEEINELVPLCGIPPPIMSRCYQELSNGMLGFNQAMKMADIPFPFPFAQLLELLLMAFTVIIPLYTAIFTGGLVATPILSFIVTVSFWGLSDISRELENPFADGHNQLPAIDMHERFVELIRMLYFTKRPAKQPANLHQIRPTIAHGKHSVKENQISV